MIKKYKNKLKKHFEEVIKIKDSPRSIALGFSIGTAIAILPTFGLGPLIGLAIILIFKKISKVSLFTSFLIWNPLIVASLYSLSYKIGDWILKDVPTKNYKFWILNQLFTHSRRFLLGNLIIAVTLTFLSYFIIYSLVKKYQRQYKEVVKEPLEKVIEKIEEKVSE